ncbi:vancomycin high temperature exclusion protein [Dactylosporangium siamense]|uniref:Membrane protein n=1 Tax=Dactylosporangium siamense TaxID=685454 RepID=A0A919UDT8_9ACTN|nr:ElyC/SanA/YdcF family protein [Dactylosporangium siamense]GIG51822.1 membrane protein [Dactylosporangium siamense]
MPDEEAPEDKTPAAPRKRWGWRKLVRRLAILAVAGVLGVVLLVAGSVIWVRSGADGHLYTEQTVPEAPVALVLGAQVYEGGTPSPFLEARLALARRLLETGKVKVLLVSGDNMHHDYDEPTAMRAWLMDHGVPERRIVRDYAGFDTYDSCSRAKRVFGVSKVTVVTQSYHIARAVMLCRRVGLDATGVGDDSVSRFKGPWRSNARREYPASVKVVYDVVSGRDPVYLGQHETGVEDALRDG